MRLAPTPKDSIFREGTAQLYRFRRPAYRPAECTAPLLIIPSLINRWYILDLREGSSVVEALNARFDTYLLDWGTPEAEDRYLTWDGVLKRLGRAVRRVLRATGAPRVGLLGYCMGGTLAGIYSALEPSNIGAFVNLAGPFDFAQAGQLRTMVDPRWFDVGAISAAGNVMPHQMQSGFTMLRPTLPLSKWVTFFGEAHNKAWREGFEALEAWSNDNTPFPAAAYQTYIADLYQRNALIQGQHYALGRRVDLSSITCPVLSITASRDTICPPGAAVALNEACGSVDKEVYTVRGGHVGAVVGSRASRELYPHLVQWLDARIGAQLPVPFVPGAPASRALPS